MHGQAPCSSWLSCSFGQLLLLWTCLTFNLGIPTLSCPHNHLVLMGKTRQKTNSDELLLSAVAKRRCSMVRVSSLAVIHLHCTLGETESHGAETRRFLLFVPLGLWLSS